MNLRPSVAFSPYSTYSRKDWARLREDTPLTLSEADLENLSGLTERVSTDEVIEIYLPLSRLPNLYVESSQELHDDTENFLRKGDRKEILDELDRQRRPIYAEADLHIHSSVQAHSTVVDSILKALEEHLDQS